MTKKHIITLPTAQWAAPDQTGCAVTFASFRNTTPPTEASRFGKASMPGMMAGCNNPAALKTGKVILTPYFPTVIPGAMNGIVQGKKSPFEDEKNAPELTTPFFTMPGFLEGECVVKDEFSFLEITVQSNPDDPRADDIGGELGPGWGLHLVDVNLVMGNLEILLKTQVESYLK